MLNPEKLQETIEVSRHILADRAQFDRAEREYKLEIAGNIASALQAVKTGADLDEPLKKAFGSPNNLTSWRTNGVFRQWAAEHPEQARRALEPFTQPDLSVEERVNRFFAELPESVVSGIGMRLMLASFFSFGSDPEHLVQYRSTAFKTAEPLLGWPAPARDLSPGATYSHHLAFVQQLETELREAGLDLRDTLDAQSLLWWLTKSDHPDCVRWRREFMAMGRTEEKREMALLFEPSADLAALVERFRTECEYPSPAHEADLAARQEFAATSRKRRSTSSTGTASKRSPPPGNTALPVRSRASTVTSTTRTMKAENGSAIPSVTCSMRKKLLRSGWMKCSTASTKCWASVSRWRPSFSQSSITSGCSRFS